ncbi:hypothetical protein C8R45DRAFT_1010939 [Mycena sanguinolenta]|nr:hypothetical protein C8R45DRAFT_1010939 [Mycena sanguinolenta]
MFPTNFEAHNDILFGPQPGKDMSPSTHALPIEYRASSSEMIGHYLNLPRHRSTLDARLFPQNGTPDSNDDWADYSAAGSHDYFEQEQYPYDFCGPAAHDYQDNECRWEPHGGSKDPPTWGVPLRSPSVSRSGREKVLHSQSAIQPLGAMQSFPTFNDTRTWPQVFKSAGTSAKRQTLACLFFRERKIGCIRPPEDAPNQTCNQCVRRKRVCEYPKECRRGHHRRRGSAKSNTPGFPNAPVP